MTRRKKKARIETIRPGVEIPFDLLDSDMLRCYVLYSLAWVDAAQPVLAWLEVADQPGWKDGDDAKAETMAWTLDDETERAQGRRFLRLMRYRPYGCLAELRRKPPEEGEFVIREPGMLGNFQYVCDVNEAEMTPGFGDPDSFGEEETYPGFLLTAEIAEAQRFNHGEAIRVCVRLMEMLGMDIPDEEGEYFEPLRVDIAEELQARADRRPRRSEDLHAMLDDLSREP
jgi:hypothetical protein